uniref:Uncharacterized protein n=1 Tax=Arundo donax TaxID=35708 RepID=A0A0A9EG24_ARUDO
MKLKDYCFIVLDKIIYFHCTWEKKKRIHYATISLEVKTNT